jgi:hypothetical protein
MGRLGGGHERAGGYNCGRWKSMLHCYVKSVQCIITRVEKVNAHIDGHVLATLLTRVGRDRGP